jgi:hypothetical protein
MERNRVNPIRNFLVTVVLVLYPSKLCAQEFRNLDFDDGVIVHPEGGAFYATVSEALPGWSAFRDDGQPMSSIFYNSLALSFASVSIHDSMSPIFPPIEGRFSIYLSGGFSLGPFGVAVSQIGTIPFDSKAIIYKGRGTERIDLSFNGETLPTINLLSTTEYSYLGADISAFAGMTGDLRFQARPLIGYGEIDSIFFSPVAVPEPSTYALGICGVFLLLISYPRFGHGSLRES